MLALTQVGIILGVNVATLEPSQADVLNNIKFYISLFSTLTLPLFLIANFSFMLRARNNGYKKLFLKYGLGSLGILTLFILVTQHYFVGMLCKSGKSYIEANIMVDQMLPSVFSGGSSLNIFIDLLICTLFFFFLNYCPVKYFKGKKLRIFRAFAVLPILYELASLIIRGLSISGVFLMPSILYPFLTNKPPFTFVAFVALVLFIKLRETHFLKKGKTIEEYNIFLNTNRNSLDVSIAISVIFIIASLLDYLSLNIVSLILGASDNLYFTIYKLGFGQATPLILSVPLVMLFSFSKEHKNTKFDTLLPFIGVAVLAFVYIEGMILTILLS